MVIAKILNLEDIQKMKMNTPVFIETKHGVRPAFFLGLIDLCLYVGETEYRYMVRLMTPNKLTKDWKYRLYNKTWRLWSWEPTREQMLTRWD